MTAEMLAGSRGKSGGSPKTLKTKKLEKKEIYIETESGSAELKGAPATAALQFVPAPVTTPPGAPSSARFLARPEIQLSKLRQAKDSVDQLVSSAMILEI